MEALSPEQESMLRSAPIRRDINDDTMDLVELKESGLITLSFTNMSGPSYMGKLTPAADVLLATLDAERERIAVEIDSLAAAMEPGPCRKTAECEGCSAEWHLVLDGLHDLAATLKPDIREAGER